MDFGVAERVKRFDSAHGNDGIAYGDSGCWLLFSDGAIRETDPLGLLQEPPDDPFEQAKLVVAYHEKLVRRATDAFADKKQNMREVINSQIHDGMGGEHYDEMEQLRELQKTVRTRQRKLNEARKQLEAVTPAQNRKRIAANASNKSLHEKFLAELHNLKI